MLNWVDKIGRSEASPLAAQELDNQFGFKRHKPTIMTHSHWHGHIEINYLFNCSVDYLFNGQQINLSKGKMIIFWASYPHQMINSHGDGEMVNIYIPLQVFLSWKLSSIFMSQLLHGNVLVSDNLYDSDRLITKIWEHDLVTDNSALAVQVISEIKGRIKRMSLENYSIYNLTSTVNREYKKPIVNGIEHIQTMLLYIAKNYDQKITIRNVSSSTGLHQNYAMKLFNRVMKITIKHYINQLRLQHAQALLVDTDSAVLNIALEAGFGSISRFYDIFQKKFEMSPLEFRRRTTLKTRLR